LLNKAAERNWKSTKVLSFRGSIADVFLQCGINTLFEANEVLLQGLVAQNESAVAATVINLVQAPLDISVRLADQFFWLTSIGRVNGEMAFSKNCSINLMLRLLQFRISVEKSPDDIDWLCEAVDNETQSFDANDKKLIRLMWTSQVLIFYQANVNSSTLIRYWEEIFNLSSSDSICKNFVKDAIKAFEPRDLAIAKDFHGCALMMILARENSPLQLLQLLQAIDKLPISHKKRAISYLRQMPYVLQLAIDRAWVKESDKSSPDWSNTICLYSKIYKIGIEWNVLDLSLFALRAIAVIEDEYLHISNKALETIEKAIALDSKHIHIAKDQKAIIFYRKKEYSMAIAIWSEILPKWDVASNSFSKHIYFACQRAGCAAGYINDMEKASEFFELGHAFAISECSLLHEATFLADDAYVHWKKGDKRKSLNLLIKSLETLEKITPNEFDKLEYHAAWKAIEQVIKWCAQESGEYFGVETFEPAVGFCNNPEINKKIKDIPKASIDLLFLFIAQIELRNDFGSFVRELINLRTTHSVDKTFVFLVARYNLQVIYRTGEFSKLIVAVTTLHNAYLERTRGDVNLADAYSGIGLDTLLVEALIAAFIILASSVNHLDKYLLEWHENIEIISVEMLTQIKRALYSNRDETYKIFQDSSFSRIERTIAAIRMASDIEAPLISMFLGQVSLFGSLQKAYFKDELSYAFGDLVKQTWLQRTICQFEFPTPRITIPPIIEACEKSLTGFKSAATILLQARFSVSSLTIPIQVLEQLESTAE